MGKDGETCTIIASYIATMANQRNIIPMGCMYGVTVDIEGASALADFEVIGMMDENNPYPALLGIVWASDMDAMINMKKKKMTFERKMLKVIVPLDPTEGAWYTKTIRDYEEDDDLDEIYKIVARDED